MAGHNKWSKIKHRKAVVDKRRGKAWTMCARAIIVAAKQGGGDANFNISLRTAMDDARYYNMPNDNIERAIKKGLGGGEGDDYVPVRYEGYGPGGAALIVDALTNNRTRTAGDIRLIFTKHESKMGVSGAVAHQFDQRGRIVVSSKTINGDAIFEAAVEAGADDVRSVDTDSDELPSWEVLTAPERYTEVLAKLKAAKLSIGETGIDMLPNLSVTVAGQLAKDLLEMIDALEDNDDVKKVYTNADIPDADLAALE